MYDHIYDIKMMFKKVQKKKIGTRLSQLTKVNEGAKTKSNKLLKPS